MQKEVGVKRQEALSALANQSWDLIVIGGGITGAGVAREAVRAGLSVLLLEQKDFAWGTSSRSSKMVHGGLRYLATGNFKLTQHSVQERERLMQEAPGLVDLMPYVWPHYKGRFPGPLAFDVLLRTYDAFARSRYRHFIPGPSSAQWVPYLKQENLMGITQFADATTDDARLVLRVLHEAERGGANIFNYTKVEQYEPSDHSGFVVVKDEVTSESYRFQARAVVNATGAWADRLRKSLGKEPKIRPCRGSHLTFPKWRLPVFSAVTLYHPEDGRALFIYPWETVTIVGTTDLDHSELDDGEVGITEEEVAYLLKAANYLFPSRKLTAGDVISTWAGVRPIVSSGAAMKPSAEKRDHTIWRDGRLLTVSGGKLTTFRLIALDVLKALKPLMPKRLSNLASGPLFTDQPLAAEDSAWGALPPQSIRRLLGFYGEDAMTLVRMASASELEPVPGTQTLWAEIRWAALNEAVVHLDDLLLRRVRLGLLLPQGGASQAEKIRNILLSIPGWNPERWRLEWERYVKIWHKYYSLPATQSEPGEVIEAAEVAISD